MKLRAWLPAAGLFAALLFVSCRKKEEPEPPPPSVAKVPAETPPKPILDDPEAKPEAKPEMPMDDDQPDEEEPSVPDNEVPPPAAKPK